MRGSASEYFPGEDEGRNGKDSGPLPPFDIGAEAGCLACILSATDETARSWLDDLSVDCFYDERHKEIYRALTCLNGDAINVVSLWQWLTDKNRIQAAGGLDYVQTLPDKTVSASLWPSYYAPLEDCRLRRAVLRDAQELIELANNRAIDTPLISDAAKRIAISYSTNSQAKELSLQSPEEILKMQFDDTDLILGDRLLCRGQPLVITGAGSIGKSRFGLQMTSSVIAAIPFLGFETRGSEMRWLILQAENSNRRLQNDLSSLKEWLTPYQWERVNKQLCIHTLETDTDYFLSLDDERTVTRIIQTIRRFRPNGILWDSLYNFAIGDLNKDEDMSNTLLSLTRISKTDNAEMTNIVLHHAITGKIGAAKATGYDRASFGRNSKVLHSWTRGQINVAPGSSSNNSLLVVSCGKCSDGIEFKPFAVRLNPISMIYEIEESFDFDAWQDELAGKQPAKMSILRVSELCSKFPLTKPELVKAIRQDSGCSSASAYRWIEKALSPPDNKPYTIVLDKDSETYSPRKILFNT